MYENNLSKDDLINELSQFRKHTIDLDENIDIFQREELFNSLLILVIEDNACLLDLTYELLNILGYKVITAIDGVEGIAKAKVFHPEVILCDIGLPGMSGYEVARSIRDNNDLKGVYLIAVTGHDKPEDIKRSKTAGFDMHMAKPVKFDMLKKALDEVENLALFK